MKTLLGYAYKDSVMYSKPNMTGYYMGDKQFTPGMQTGGQARIARAKQYRGDEQAFREAERSEGKRQRKKSGWGKFGSLAGGLIGAALAPVTGGASLALAAGLGSYAGGRLGGRAGGKPRSGGKGTVFLQDQFGDIAKAGRAFDKQQKDQALTSALMTGLTAGFNPASMYGKVAGQSAQRGVAGWGTRLAASQAAPTAGMTSLASLATPSLTGGLQAAPSFNAPKLFSSGFGTPTSSTFALSAPSMPSLQPSYANLAQSINPASGFNMGTLWDEQGATLLGG